MEHFTKLREGLCTFENRLALQNIYRVLSNLCYQVTLSQNKRNGFWGWYLMKHFQNKINENEVH